MVEPSSATVKFLCSYGGKIVPRHPDGKLRYHGGHTRVLSVPRSLSFAEVLAKMGELCGTSVTLRCQLPTEDLDALVSIKSDEDLANLIQEYDHASPSLKIRAFLFAPKSAKKVSGHSANTSFGSVVVSPSSRSSKSSDSEWCTRQIGKQVGYQNHRVPQLNKESPEMFSCFQDLYIASYDKWHLYTRKRAVGKLINHIRNCLNLCRLQGMDKAIFFNLKMTRPRLKL